jgi:hypothetical protein
MFNRHKLPVTIVVALMLTLLMSITVASAQEAALGGSANFRDADALNDSLEIALTGVPAISGSYEGWLVTNEGDKISVGWLTRIVDGTITATYLSPSGEDLLATYVGFALSQEPTSYNSRCLCTVDPDPATAGPILYSDRIPAEVESSVQLLVVGADSIAGKLRQQAQAALDHALLAQTSVSLADKQIHAQSVANIINGARRGPSAYLGAAGDNIGVIGHAEKAAVEGGNAQSAAGDDLSVAKIAAEVTAAANNTIIAAGRARDAALRVMALGDSPNETVLRLELENVANLSRSALTGTDGNGDGITGNVGAEGGANTVYTKSQDLGQFKPQLGSDPLAPVTGDPWVPALAQFALFAGLLFTFGGGYMVFRQRRMTA